MNDLPIEMVPIRLMGAHARGRSSLSGSLASSEQCRDARSSSGFQSATGVTRSEPRHHYGRSNAESAHKWKRNGGTTNEPPPLAKSVGCLRLSQKEQIRSLRLAREALTLWESVRPLSFATPLRHGKLDASGGSSSAGRASVCGTECRGFKPRLPPQLDLNFLLLTSISATVWRAKISGQVQWALTENLTFLWQS
jgi:hypothetical protein